jgi:uncharacterized protein YaiI (UPF0178 family)
MTIWIDADAAPREVKEIVYRAAQRLGLPAVLVANKDLVPPRGNPFVRAVRVAGGLDVADAYIAAEAQAGDVAVTADVPLAAKLVARGVAVLDPRGTEYTEENVGDRLSMRDLMDHLRTTGLVTGGPRAFDAKARQAFAAALDRVLTRVRRARPDR